MPLTYLTKKEKLLSLLHIAGNELSSNIVVQNKQYEVIQIFHENYIKECDYYPYVRIIVKKDCKDREIIYTLNWDIKKKNEEEALAECDRIISNLQYRNKKYLDITKVLINELSKTKRPTREQLDYVNDFTRFHEDWMIKDPTEYIPMFHDTYYLQSLVEYMNRY